MASYTDYDGDVTIQTFNGVASNDLQISEVVWFNSTTSTHNPGDTYTYEYYADGALDSARIDYATGAVVVTSFYDSGSVTVNGPPKSLIRSNTDGSGTVIGYDVNGVKTSEVDQNADGSKIVKGWNTAAASPWTNYVITYDADGTISDARFTLKDSIQNPSTGVWSSTLTLYDSNNLNDHSVLLMTKAELIEENQAQPANAKHDVQQRVTLPDGENYLVTVKADRSIYAKNEHGSTFEAILNDVELAVTVVVDIAAAISQQYWVIVAAAAVSTVDAATQFAEGNIQAGLIDLITAVSFGGIASAGGFAAAGALPYEEVLAGVGIGEGLEALVVGAINGNILAAVAGVAEAAGAAVLGFGHVSVNTAVGLEIGEAVIGTSAALANGNVEGGIAAAIGAIGGVYAAENPASGSAATSANSLTNSAITTGAAVQASGNGASLIQLPTTQSTTVPGSFQLASNVPSVAAVNAGLEGVYDFSTTTYLPRPSTDIQAGTVSASYTPVQSTPAATPLAPISPGSYTATSTEFFSNPYAFLPLLALMAVPGVGELAAAGLLAEGASVALVEGVELIEAALPEIAQEELALSSIAAGGGGAVAVETTTAVVDVALGTTNTLKVGSAVLTVDRAASSGALIFSQGATEADALNFFNDLIGGAQTETRVVSGGTITTATTSEGSFTFRDFAKSSDTSGPVWTIDVPDSLKSLFKGFGEIEFRK